MKRNFLLSLILLMAFNSYCQIQWTGYNNSFFIKELPVNAHSGKNFRFEIAVFSSEKEPVNSIHLEMATYENQTLVKKHAVTESRREQDWVVFTLSGNIPAGADKLCVITTLKDRGSFYFDDVNFYVEENPLQWKQVGISNPSFEEGSYRIPGYIISSPDNIHGYQLSSEIFKVGSQSLLLR